MSDETAPPSADGTYIPSSVDPDADPLGTCDVCDARSRRAYSKGVCPECKSDSQRCSACGDAPAVWNENELFFGSYYLTCGSCGHPFFDITRDEARASDIDLRTPDEGLPFHDFQEGMNQLKAVLVEEIVRPLGEFFARRFK